MVASYSSELLLVDKVDKNSKCTDNWNWKSSAMLNTLLSFWEIWASEIKCPTV